MRIKTKQTHSSRNVPFILLLLMTVTLSQTSIVPPPALPFTKMCIPFLPNVKPMTEEEIKLHGIEKCFHLEAYPLGKRNHVHLSFRQWPLVNEPHCENFIATNASFQAFNKYSWPFGRWLSTFHIQDSQYCTEEDKEIAAAEGYVRDCDRLMTLPQVTRNFLRTITQSPTKVRKVNLFKYEIRDLRDNRGGICMNWGYNSKFMKVPAASDLGGIRNARRYFASFSVTFRAELFIVPKKSLNIRPFVMAIQTETLKFNGDYLKDHHVARCHHFSTKNKNFKRSFFTRDLILPKAYEDMITHIITSQKNRKSRVKNLKINSTYSQQTNLRPFQLDTWMSQKYPENNSPMESEPKNDQDKESTITNSDEVLLVDIQSQKQQSHIRADYYNGGND